MNRTNGAHKYGLVTVTLITAFILSGCGNGPGGRQGQAQPLGRVGAGNLGGGRPGAGGGR
jgi:hypothetical protein